jgi:hypothetical protein
VQGFSGVFPASPSDRGKSLAAPRSRRKGGESGRLAHIHHKLLLFIQLKVIQ